MFGFFKKKNKETAPEVIASAEIEEEVTEEADIQAEEAIAPEEAVSESFEETVEETAEETVEEVLEEVVEVALEEPKEEKKPGFFARLKAGLGKTRAALNEKVDSVLKFFKKIDEELYEELEEALIMADVGVETSTFIIEELRKKVKEKHLTESEQVKGEIQEIVSEILCENDNTLKLDTPPAVIMVIGVNGVGKTTSIGKMAAKYISEGKKVLLGAADTFRAAAIDQLAVWADRAGVDMVKSAEGADPASVVFDTVAAAKARQSDVIIIDTAGRLHNKKNLMNELAKMYRILKRELPESDIETLLVLDATTGQNAVNQARDFKEVADITGIILTKLDGTARGGVVLAIMDELKIPVKYIGVGEQIDDLQPFDPDSFAKAIFSEEA